MWFSFALYNYTDNIEHIGLSSYIKANASIITPRWRQLGALFYRNLEAVTIWCVYVSITNHYQLGIVFKICISFQINYVAMIYIFEISCSVLCFTLAAWLFNNIVVTSHDHKIRAVEIPIKLSTNWSFSCFHICVYLYLFLLNVLGTITIV